MKSQTKLKKNQFRPVIAWIIGGFLFISLWALITVLLLIMLKKDDIMAQQRTRRNRSRLRENYTTVTERDSLGITPAMHTEFEKMLYSKPGVDYPCKDSTTAIKQVQRIVKCFNDNQIALEDDCRARPQPLAITDVPLPIRDCPRPLTKIDLGYWCGDEIGGNQCVAAGGECDGDYCIAYV
jgi:hypothetical protein